MRMISGKFDQGQYPQCRQVRDQALLASKEPTLEALKPIKNTANNLRKQVPEILRNLKDFGHFLMLISESLSDRQLISLSQDLGIPLREEPEELRPYVREQVILEVKEQFSYMADVALQPFSRDPLFVHTENSRLPVSKQPRYILFHCRSSNSLDSPTYIYPMAEIAAVLSSDDLGILGNVYYTNTVDPAPLFRKDQGLPIFSFRDFGHETLDWVYRGNRTNICETDVNDAIERLIVSVYQTPPKKIIWIPQMLFVFDNFRYFHARPKSTNNGLLLHRHLDRIRIGTNLITANL